MARKTKKEVLAARQDASAPFLFDAETLPHRPDMVKAVQERRYEATGARLLDDDNKVMRLVDLLLRHPPIGLRKIARALGVSRDTVRAAREALVTQGKLAPYRERVVRLYEEIIEGGAASYLEDLENGLVPASTKPLAIGIFADKRALAVGEPTMISMGSHVQVRPEALSVKALNSWVEGLTVDAESTVMATIPSQIKTSGDDAATFAASDGRRDRVNGDGGQVGDPVAIGADGALADGGVGEGGGVGSGGGA